MVGIFSVVESFVYTCKIKLALRFWSRRRIKKRLCVEEEVSNLILTSCQPCRLTSGRRWSGRSEKKKKESYSARYSKMRPNQLCKNTIFTHSFNQRIESIDHLVKLSEQMNCKRIKFIQQHSLSISCSQSVILSLSQSIFFPLKSNFIFLLSHSVILWLGHYHSMTNSLGYSVTKSVGQFVTK